MTSVDLSNDAFPYRTAREIDIGFARVLCIRITYLGELGYELYIPSEQAVHVYERLVRGRRVGRAAARRAEGAGEPAHGEGVPRLRPRHRQHRLGARGRARVRGRPRQARRLHRPRRRRWRRRPRARCAGGWCRSSSATPSRCCSTPRWCTRNGKPVGYVRAASYGFTLGGAVGLAMIDAGEPIDKAYVDATSWEVDIAGTLLPGDRVDSGRCTTPPWRGSRRRTAITFQVEASRPQRSRAGSATADPV